MKCGLGSSPPLCLPALISEVKHCWLRGHLLGKGQHRASCSPVRPRTALPDPPSLTESTKVTPRGSDPWRCQHTTAATGKARYVQSPSCFSPHH